MWVPILLISPLIIRIFCPKTTKFGIFVRCWLIWCPVGGLVGGCGARAVARKTYLLYIIISIFRQEDTGLVRPYGLAALGAPQGPGEAVEVMIFVLSRFFLHM